MAKFAIIFVYRHDKKLAVQSLCIIIKEKFSHKLTAKFYYLY